MKAFLVIPLFLLAGCDPSSCNLLGPSKTGSTSGLPWSPYLGIHASGEAHEAYRETLPLLISNGNLRGARVGISPREGVNGTIKMIGDLGIELVGIIDNEYLLDPNIEDQIDQIYTDYPEISYFQVGNEVTNPGINTATLSIVQYMLVLRRVYDHTQRNYSKRNITLITQSTFGSCRSDRTLECQSGALEIGEMARLGLREMSNRKLIIGVNVYSRAALVEYANEIRSRLSGYRVWVMETGTSNRLQHKEFVKNFYPSLRDDLRAERIYWYAAWVGDSGPESEYGLIGNVFNPPLIFSPLFNALAGTEE